MTVSGKTIGENHKDVIFPSNQKVIYKTSRAIKFKRRFCWAKRKSSARRSYCKSCWNEEEENLKAKQNVLMESHLALKAVLERKD